MTYTFKYHVALEMLRFLDVSKQLYLQVPRGTGVKMLDETNLFMEIDYLISIEKCAYRIEK